MRFREKLQIGRSYLIGSKNSNLEDHLLRIKIVKIDRHITAITSTQMDAARRMTEEDRRVSYNEIHVTLGLKWLLKCSHFNPRFFYTFKCEKS